MKTARPFILFALFILFLAAGVYFSRSFWGSLLYFRNPSGNLESRPFSDQFKVILVRVDDLKAEQPRVLSCWGIFATSAQVPSMVFMPLCPQDSLLLSESSLISGGSPSARFLQHLDGFPFQRDAYLLVDQEAFNRLHEWITGSQAALHPRADFLSQDPAQRLIEEKVYFDEICLNLSQPGKSRTTDQPWDVLIPAHLRTDLAFEKAAHFWETIEKSSIPMVCEVHIAP